MIMINTALLTLQSYRRQPRVSDKQEKLAAYQRISNAQALLTRRTK